MKNLIKEFVRSLLRKHLQLAVKIGRFFGGKYQVNINLDLLNSQQKKVLLSYLYLEDVDLTKVKHTNYMHANQIVKYFIDNEYCVDVCACSDIFSYEILKHKKYDIIIGLGEVFKRICKDQPNAQKIIFITENNPIIVAQKYAERIAYFTQRHPYINCNASIIRKGYIDEDMFETSDLAIIMNSRYNAESMKHYFDNVYLINSNAFINTGYAFDRANMQGRIEQTKRNFLWFGSDGFIHKGVDILIDAFKEMPEFSISFYGLSTTEKSLFHKLKASNTVDCGRINVQNPEFVDTVINRHCFIIFPSCSEGMSTAVATCMAHGIIPILTKECGFEPNEYIIELEGWHIEDIKNAVNRAVSMTNEEILTFREGCFQYACENFSLKKFDSSFKGIMDKILNKQ